MQPIDPLRPAQEFTVGDIVTVRVQQGLSGTWWAWTKEPHPCPGNQPERVWGSGETMQQALHQVAESVELLNRMGCVLGQQDWRTYL